MASAVLAPRFESSPRTYRPALSRCSCRVRAATNGQRKASSRGASPRRRPGGTWASRRSSSSRVWNRRSMTCLLAGDSPRGVVGQRVPSGQEGGTVELYRFFFCTLHQSVMERRGNRVSYHRRENRQSGGRRQTDGRPDGAVVDEKPAASQLKLTMLTAPPSNTTCTTAVFLPVTGSTAALL